MDKEFLGKLLGTISPSGYEEDATKVWNDYCSKFSKHVWTDKMGNSCFSIGSTLRPGTKNIMLSGHIDEIGFQVQSIAESGLLYVIGLGGIDKKVLPGAEVMVQGKDGQWIPGIIGKKAIHVETPDERDKAEKLEDLPIDIGAESKEAAMELVEVGSVVGFKCNYTELGGNRFMSKGLDDKIGVFIVAEVMKNLSSINPTVLDGTVIYGVSNTQEEEGLRGARVSSARLNPDISIDIDVTFATDEGRGIKSEKHGDVRLGGGAVIQNGPDKSKRIVKMMKRIAATENIPYQLASSYSGGTNTSAIQECSRDCETILVSIPNRNMHTQVEVCDYRDIQSAIDIITKTVIELIEE